LWLAEAFGLPGRVMLKNTHVNSTQGTQKDKCSHHGTGLTMRGFFYHASALAHTHMELSLGLEPVSCGEIMVYRYDREQDAPVFSSTVF
jgi:hypothetical protein